MKIYITKISPGSLAASLALGYGCVAFCAILLMGLAGAIGMSFSFGNAQVSGAGIATLIGILPMLFIYPFVSAFTGGITGLIIAWAYNFATRFIDGLLIETREAPKWH